MPIENEIEVYPAVDVQVDRGSATNQLLQWNDTTKRFEVTTTLTGITLGTPWTLAGDGSWTGASELDMSDAAKTITVNSVGAGLSFKDTSGNNYWSVFPFLSVVDIGNTTTNPYFNFLGTGTVSMGGDLNVTGDVGIGGDLTTEGGRVVNTTNIDHTGSPYTALASDHEIFVDTDGGAVTLNLPAGVDGTNYRIENCGSSKNKVTVVPNGTELLRGVNEGKTMSDGSIVILTYNSTQGWR